MWKPWLVLLSGALSLLGAAGCTVYPDKPGNLKSTTSAEQTERLFWQAVRKEQWTQVEPLLAANVVWTEPGKTLSHDEILPYLKALDLRDFTIRDVTVKPNGADMTLTYSLQISSNGAPQREMLVASVWQKVGSNQVLILRTEEPSHP